MNKELLKLFDIKDDVDRFTIDNLETIYKINVWFKPSCICCSICGNIHFNSKDYSKRTLVSNPMNDKPVNIITHVKRYRYMDCGGTFSDSNPISYEN